MLLVCRGRLLVGSRPLLLGGRRVAFSRLLLRTSGRRVGLPGPVLIPAVVAKPLGKPSHVVTERGCLVGRDPLLLGKFAHRVPRLRRALEGTLAGDQRGESAEDGPHLL